jgi:hypothetical protein
MYLTLYNGSIFILDIPIPPTVVFNNNNTKEQAEKTPSLSTAALNAVKRVS